MSQSAIYVVNTSSQTVAAGSTISLGTVIRRFGPNLKVSGNAIQICGNGYYDIDASITLVPSAAGSVTITAYKDNVAIPGATATETVAATDTTVNLSLSSMIREGCSYCNGLSNVTFVVSGTAAEILNVAIVMEKK